MPAIPPAILFGIAAAVVAALAIILVQRSAGFTRRNAPLFAAFAGGVVITLAVAHLIPEALVMVSNAPWLVLAGFGTGFVIHNIMGAGAHDHAHPQAHGHAHAHHHAGDEGGEGRVRLAALAPVIAIALHSALDGAIYAVTFEIDVLIGASTALGLLVHEFPEALICFVLLQRAGLGDRASAILAFIASGLTTLGFAVGTVPFATALEPQTLGVMFAFLAGVLLHVGAAHLIHEAGEAGAFKGGLAVLAGALVAVAMTMGHSHDHAHDEAHGEAHDELHGDAHDHAHGEEHGDAHDYSPEADHDQRPDSDDGHQDHGHNHDEMHDDHPHETF